MADRSMIMLAVIATVLVLYVIKQERMSGKKKMHMKAKAAAGPVGSRSRKPTASLGSSLGSSDCTNVDIDSPNFTRCSLGSGRSVIRSKPRGDSLNHAFKEDNYEVRGGALGNPFAVKLDDNFNKDTDRKLGAKAFPFSKSGALPKYEEAMRNKSMKYAQKPLNPQQKEHRGHKFDKIHKAQRMVVEAPSRGSSRASVSLGASVSTVDGMGYNEAFLGAAVSPSTLGATPEEIAQSTNKLDDINEVASNTGGNLNLLHPL